MKGNSKDYYYFRELVDGVNQYSEFLNPPWKQAVKTVSVGPLKPFKWVLIPTRVATRVNLSSLMG